MGSNDTTLIWLVVGFIVFMFVVKVIAAFINSMGLTECPACKSEIPKGATVCAHCQTVQPK